MARQSVAWADSAWRDLENAADYISQDSPQYAAALVREMRDASRALADFSGRGRIVPELNDPEIRELILGNYRLIYRTAADTVTILAVIHGARSLEKALANR
jgi:toxin ParE1/3/4